MSATDVTPPTLTAPLHPVLPPQAVTEPARRPLRIVLVSQYFSPEVGATQLRIQAFAEYLASRGHRVTVICEFPNHPHGLIPESYRGRVLEDDRSNAYRILRVWVKTTPEKTQTTRMALYLSYMGLATAVAPLAGRADVVVATSPPLFAGVCGVAIARMNGAPFVLDVRDLWPAAATSLGQISPGVVTAVAEALERWLYRQAAVVVAVTRPFCDHVDRIRRRDPATALVPNGTLDLFLEPPPAPPERAPHGLPEGRFLVTFAGIHGIAQALPSVLESAARLNGSADFAFVGDGPLKETIVRDAAARALPNVHFRPQLAPSEVSPILHASDALLVPLSAHPTFADFVPSKLLDFMAAGKPVIVSASGEAARILELAGAGLAVPPEDPDALAQAVQWVRDHPDEAQAMGRRGRDFAQRRLRSHQAARLEQVLLDVVQKR